MADYLELHGCRHDILGHYLKAIGLLRVLAKCADEQHRDPDAEGWWDSEKACFCLRSRMYDTREKMAMFFALHYRPTPVFAAWNKEPGIVADESEKLAVSREWQVATGFSSRVASATDRKKPAASDRLSANEAFELYREAVDPAVTEALDAISASFLKTTSDHPLFLSKGIAGRAHIWRTHWNYLLAFQRQRINYQEAVNKLKAHTGTEKRRAKLKEEAAAVLQAIADTLPFLELSGCGSAAAGKGTPFFPDAVKAYNIGSGWVTENYPFNGLDYVLAVEGAFAMRGSVGRTLAANSKRFAAFPFLFDACEDLVDDAGEVKGTSSALWFPLWERPVTFSELSSFISDAQARLPAREARFSSEFMRALHSQGVDAGFSGWQEFRFKMKASRVPWVTTGIYLEARFRQKATRLARALQPLDESGFLDQFQIKWKGNKADAQSPHPVATAINEAMETAMREATAHHCLELLGAVFRACRQVSVSKAFREKLTGGPRFFRPLPMDDWGELLRDLEDEPEFRIARAIASIRGSPGTKGANESSVLPMLGSLLPLKVGKGGVWYLPRDSETPSKQAVWTGSDLCHDLAAVLARRYLDSLNDDRPALMSSFGARLSDVLAFLNGEVDDHLIARWVEALSLIGWTLPKAGQSRGRDESDACAIPIEYAALRTLLELECEERGGDQTAWQKRRSQQPLALLCQRAASTLPLAVKEALRWIAIWGVPSPDGARLKGRDILSLTAFSPCTQAARLAAAVCIPIHWRDRRALYGAVSLPQAD